MSVAQVTLRTLNRPWPYRHLAAMVTTTRRVYRSGTGLVGPAHNDYVLGADRLAGGDPASLAPALDLAGVLVIAHDNRARPEPRDRGAQEYRRLRRLTGAEAA